MDIFKVSEDSYESMARFSRVELSASLYLIREYHVKKDVGRTTKCMKLRFTFVYVSVRIVNILGKIQGSKG